MGTLSFLRRLAADPTANTIVISAVSLVPLLGMVGGGVDASRYYMTTTRLQAACDAGALAARKSMENGEFTAEVEAKGDAFFEQNYEDGLFGIENLQHDYSATDDGEVVGTASGALPTSLMHIFGYDNFNVSVTCTADINISNTDVMFVVDVTGSMNCNPDNPSGGNCGNSEDSDAKIKGLRNAVMTFYDTVEESTSDTAQVRYGMVPYASNVNVGSVLKAANPDWLATSHTYQSREANFTLIPGEWEETGKEITEIIVDPKPTLDDEWDGTNSQQEYGVTSEAQCDALKPEDEVEFDDSLGTHQGALSQTTNGDIRTTSYRDDNEDIIYRLGFTKYNAKKDRCRYGWRVYRDWKGDVLFDVVEQLGEDEEVFDNWTYKQVEHDLTELYDDDRVTLMLGDNGTERTIIWDGCIEEADTIAQADFDPVPTGAYDLNINLIPSTAAERWKPVLYGAVWKRENSSGNVLGELTQTGNENRASYSCPAAAFRLTELENTDSVTGNATPSTRGDLQAYVNALQARSNTYHDIGMIWGARFISPNGIFSATNTSAPNGDAIGRHIVFMTDGLLAPNVEVYGTYGVEWWDRRVTGDANNANSRHAERFQAACRAARQENISVWVVAFGTDLTQNLIDCATPGRTFVASNSEELEESFKEIAQKIAALRLTN